jgi:hypothetical protein
MENNNEPLIAHTTDFEMGEAVLVTPTDNPNDVVQHEFMGRVIGVRNGRYVMVRDQEDNVFDCEPVQVHHLS